MNFKRIKTTIPFLIFSCFVFQTTAQPYFEWGKNLGGSDYDFASAVAVDAAGNTYTTGNFDGTADFNPGSGTNNLSSAGNSDVFVCKLDAAGNLVWARAMGGFGYDGGMSIAVDSKGNVYTVGYFMATADFNPGSGTATMNASGNGDIFISKLDAGGNFVWAKQMSGSLSELPTGISLDEKGNILVCGAFEGTVDFNPGSGTNTLSANAVSSAFIVKLNASGNYIWAKKFGNNGDNYANALCTDKTGNVFTTGYFTGTVDFDPGSGTYTLSAAADRDVYISKLDSNGNYVRAWQFEGDGLEEGRGITLDNSGNIYTTGTFTSNCDFDPGSSNFDLSSGGNEDVFVCKLNSSGNIVWARNFGGSIDDFAYSIAVDSRNCVYTTGSFNSSADFDPGTSDYYLYTSGGKDIFISKLDASGNLEWSKQIGGTGFDNRGIGLALDAKRNIYTVGYFNDTADSDPNSGTSNIVSNGSLDGFVQKMSQCLTTSANLTISACESFVSPSGKYTWTISNNYRDTITNVNGCDSVIDIQLKIFRNIQANFNFTSCIRMVSPSGKYIWSSSNTYKDTIKTVSGCDSFLNITLNIIKVDSGISANSQSITANEPGATYQWYDCKGSGILINGATQQSYTPVVSGSYFVKITKNSCSVLSPCIQFYLSSINSILELENISLFPNPSESVFTFKTSSGKNIGQITIYDLAGNIVYNLFSEGDNTIETNLKHLNSGLYYAVLQIDGKFYRVLMNKL